MLVACHNEQTAIAEVVHRCRQACEPHTQILVVDDGSIDDTANQALQAGAQVLRLAVNGGKGAALRAGLQAAHGEWIATIDGDGQDDPAELPLLRAAVTADVGLVIGSRFRGKLERGAILPLNLVGNLALTATFDLLYGQPISDTQAGFRLIRGDLARGLQLRSSQYEIETEVLAQVLRAGWRVVEVPVTRRARVGGTTDFRRVANGLKILAMMIRCRFGQLG